MITALVALGTVTYVRKQTNHTEKQLLVSNFATIIDYIGNEDTRQNRRVLYNNFQKMQILLSKYPDIRNDEELVELQETAKQISAMYDRVGFLLEQDEELEEKIIDFHGFTIAIVWKLVQPIHKKWIEKDKALEYLRFKKIGEKAYQKFKEETDIWLENNKKRQSN